MEEAVDDMDEGKNFYNLREFGVGEYFWDSLISDIESLIIYAGIHKKDIRIVSNVCQAISLCHLLRNRKQFCICRRSITYASRSCMDRRANRK
jgi:hypothetical protein